MKRRLLITLVASLLGAGHQAHAQTNQETAATYKLQIQDTLLFSVREDPIANGTSEPLRVNALGEVHFPVSRGFDEHITLKVAGKTVDQVNFEIKALLNVDYYQEATVFLKLVDQQRRAGEVLFFGAVRGNILALPPGEPKTIFEGTYQVGLGEFANLKKVRLYRVDPKTGERITKVINLEAIKEGDRSQDIPLQDGDRVEVPEKKIVF